MSTPDGSGLRKRVVVIQEGHRWTPGPPPPNPIPRPPRGTAAEIGQACRSTQRSVISHSRQSRSVLNSAVHWTSELWNGARLLADAPPPPMPALPEIEIRPGPLPRVPGQVADRILRALDELVHWSQASGEEPNRGKGERKKKSTEKGEARAKIIAALT